MVVVKLIGGLGNQMFQYALGRKLAHDHKVGLTLDISAFEKDRLRKYGLQHFTIPGDVIAGDLVIPDGHHVVVREQHYHFDATLLNRPKNSYLIGYWQSEKYFIDIAGVIRQEFTVQGIPLGLNRQLYDEILATNAISLHVRRGDYVTNQVTNQYHGVLPLGYYQQAIWLMTQYVKNPHLYIFSDDVLWARKNITGDCPLYFVTHNGEEYDYEDLRLMSACKHQIIANSSFSWWGAWLNDNPGKKVIAPGQWFQHCPHDTKDLIPSQWIRI